MNAAGSRTPADSQQHSNTEALRTHGVVPAAPVSWGSNLRIHRDEGCPLLSAIAARSSPAASMALLHLARWCGWRVAKWSRFPSVRLPEVLKAVNLCHCRWRSGTPVEDAGLSGRQMQQCPHPTPLVCVHGAHVHGGGLHAQGVAIVPASLLRSALGCDRVLSDAEVGLVATAVWTRLHPAA
jgi:hypothetical protein